NGTVMEVTDLFYNTPARLKFLKKPATEAGYISDIMARFIFAHPEISFKLIRDGKEAVFSSGDNKLINAVYAVYGKDYARNMLEVDYEFNGIHVTGAVGKGTLTRSNRNYETFFVNRRYIKSPLMIRALEEAYKNQIMISKFPTAVLNVDIDVSSVDINVHPTKLECKFSNEHDVYQAVYHAVKQTLYALPNVPEIERGEKKRDESAEETSLFEAERGVQRTLEEIYGAGLRREPKPRENFKFKTEHRETPRSFETPSSREREEEKRYVRNEGERVTAMAPAETERPAAPVFERPKADSGADEPKRETEKAKEVDTFAMLDYAMKRASGRNGGKLEVNDPSGDDGAFALSAEDNNEGGSQTVSEPSENVFDGGFRVIGQLFDTYILIEKDDRLLIIDQHAAHERLNYESLKAELEENGISSQMFIEPVIVNLSGEEFAVFSENSELFYRLGFDAEVYGINTVIIRSAPGEVSWSETEPLFTELLTQAADMKQELIAEEKQRLIYTIACKASIKANMRIDEAEMHDLAARVFALENINTCPHGRPIVISMSKKEIEKEFKRIV
ncbi:MAG TPA: hypothetical protein IAA61_05280, partial [Candidatus Ornithomonoglobus merdipullorum]|nr:hypothetical protein [Candidatus Ornithomonoglobus merdipullorum]